MITRVIRTLTVFILLTACMSTLRDGAAQEFLSGTDIKKALAGNTIKFPNARGPGIVFIYFGPNGSVEQNTDVNPSRIFRKKWWIDKDVLFCRESGRRNRPLCSKVTVSGDTVKFFRRGERFRFEATVLKGRQLPK